MATHPAVVTVAPRAPLEIHQLPTLAPEQDEILVRVEWTASTPLDMHQADGGLLVKHPQVLGDGIAGTVVGLGTEVKDLKVGDQVFGFAFHGNKEKAHQILVTAPIHLFGKIPCSIAPSAAVTLPNNLVTAFHTLVTDLGLEFPWPRPDNYIPQHANTPILIWGASSSVGQFALQILKHWNYTNITATASPKHHARLQQYGAKTVFDYRDPNVVTSIRDLLSLESSPPLILDCIGSESSSLAPIASTATEPGTTVAAMLPIIIRSPSPSTSPIYSMDVATSASWSPRIEVRGVRTHFYEQNPHHRAHLQPEIIPTLLATGVVEPNNQYMVEGETLLERAEKALEKLRSGSVSGERVVWRVWRENEYPEYK